MRLFAAWYEEARASRALRRHRHDARDRRRKRPAERPHGAAQGLRRAGFVFYTNTDSAKGRELARNPKAALVFHWPTLNRQIRLRGPVAPVAPAEADAYFATRPRLAQIGAWASKQSAPLESRLAFEKAIARDHGETRHRHGAAPAELVGLSADATGDGVLARPAVPAARPRRIPPFCDGRTVEQDTIVSVNQVNRAAQCALALAKARAAGVPSPACGRGLGRGHVRYSLSAKPSPHPSPASGRGSRPPSPHRSVPSDRTRKQMNAYVTLRGDDTGDEMLK